MQSIYYESIKPAPLDVPKNETIEALRLKQSELIDLQNSLMQRQTSTTHEVNNLTTELKELEIKVLLDGTYKNRIIEIKKRLSELNKEPEYNSQIYNLSQAILLLNQQIESLENTEIFDVIELKLIRNIDTELNELQSLIEKIDSKIIEVLKLSKASANFHNRVVRKPYEFLTHYNYQMFDKLNAFIENNQRTVNNYLLNKNKESE